MSQSTLITSRDPKGLQIANLFDVTLNKAKLDHEHAQRLIENGGEFQEGLAQLIERFSATNQYAEEEVESSYGYLSGYRQAKPLDQQVRLLNGFFPGIGNIQMKLVDLTIPDSTEGLFAIPRWQRVGKTYVEALFMTFAKIIETRNGKFHNYREGRLGPNRLRLVSKTVKALEMLASQQLDTDHHIMVIGCQFGLCHRGRSVRRAREVMPVYEFGLDPFSVACMLLTHPGRLKHCDDLWINCAGADYEFGNVGRFGDAPYFGFDGGGVGFDTSGSDRAHGGCGSASGVLPQ